MGSPQGGPIAALGRTQSELFRAAAGRERAAGLDAQAVVHAELREQEALDREMREVQRLIDDAAVLAAASSKPQSPAAVQHAAVACAAAARNPPTAGVDPPAAAAPAPAAPVDTSVSAVGLRRVERRQRLKKRPLRVRTPTDILKEQVASTPGLQYWWPEGGLCGVHTVDASEEPLVQVQGSARFRVGSAHRQGPRPTMEDRSVVYGSLRGQRTTDLFAVFDGHGSRGEADFAAAYLPACMIHEMEVAEDPTSTNQLLCSAFRQTSNAMRGKGQGMTTGTTAVVAVLVDSKLHVANVGDSNAVLSYADGSARVLTTEHKPSLASERERIEAMDGGLVTVSQRNGIARVQGQLAVSRALGDFHLEPYVTSEPSSTTVDLSSAEGSGPEFLIVACDGVWDVYDARGASMEVRKAVHHAEVKAAKKAAKDGGKQEESGSNAMDLAAGVLCDKSLGRGSTDNISVVVVDLRPLKSKSCVAQEPEPEPQEMQTTSSAGRSPGQAPLGVFSPDRLPYPAASPGHRDNGAVEVGWRIGGSPSKVARPTALFASPAAGDTIALGSPGLLSPAKRASPAPSPATKLSPMAVSPPQFSSRDGGGRRGAANLLQGTDSCPLPLGLGPALAEARGMVESWDESRESPKLSPAASTATVVATFPTTTGGLELTWEELEQVLRACFPDKSTHPIERVHSDFAFWRGHGSVRCGGLCIERNQGADSLPDRRKWPEVGGGDDYVLIVAGSNVCAQDDADAEAFMRRLVALDGYSRGLITPHNAPTPPHP